MLFLLIELYHAKVMSEILELKKAMRALFSRVF